MSFALILYVAGTSCSRDVLYCMLSCVLSGALGRRTRFQTSDLAQLILSVKVSDDVVGGGAGREKHAAEPQNGSEPIKFPTVCTDTG